MKIVLSALVALAVLVGSGGALYAQESDPFIAKLPDGEGKQLIGEMCVRCHAGDRIVKLRKDAAGWQKSVVNMVGRGVQLFPEEVDVIAKYLTKHLNLSVPMAGVKK